MMAKSGGVNLLPRLTKGELRKEQQRSTITLGTAGITLVVSFLSVGLLLFQLYQQYSINGSNLPIIGGAGLDGEIAQLNNKIDQNLDVLTIHTELSTKLSFVDEIITNRPDYQQTLDRLQDLLPDSIEIKSYEVNESYEIKLSGVAQDYFAIALFINRAQKEDLSEGYFDAFNLESASFREDVVNFTISAVAIFPEEINVITENEF